MSRLILPSKTLLSQESLLSYYDRLYDANTGLSDLVANGPTLTEIGGSVSTESVGGVTCWDFGSSSNYLRSFDNVGRCKTVFALVRWDGTPPAPNNQSVISSNEFGGSIVFRLGNNDDQIYAYDASQYGVSWNFQGSGSQAAQVYPAIIPSTDWVFMVSHQGGNLTADQPLIGSDYIVGRLNTGTANTQIDGLVRGYGMSTGVIPLSVLVAQARLWMRQMGYEGHLKSSIPSQYGEQALYKPAPVSVGREVLNRTGLPVYHSSRTAERHSGRFGFDHGTSSLPETKMIAGCLIGASYFGVPQPSDPDLRNHTASANVSVEVGDGYGSTDTYDVSSTSSGGTLVDSYGGYAGNQCFAFMARLKSGVIPAESEAGFRNGSGTYIGAPIDLTQLTQQWTLYSTSIAATTTDFAFTFGSGECVVEISEYRVCGDYFVPCPINSEIEVLHVPSNSFAWGAVKGTFAIAFKVSSTCAGDNFPQGGAYIFDAGNWSLRTSKSARELILEVNGTDRITISDFDLTADWTICRVDYDSSANGGSGEVGLKVNKDVRYTYTTTDIPTTNRIDIGGSTLATLPIYGEAGLIHFEMDTVTDESEWEAAVDEFMARAREFDANTIQTN